MRNKTEECVTSGWITHEFEWHGRAEIAALFHTDSSHLLREERIRSVSISALWMENGSETKRSTLHNNVSFCKYGCIWCIEGVQKLHAYFPKSQSNVPASLWTRDDEEKMTSVSKQWLNPLAGFENEILSSSERRNEQKKLSTWGQNSKMKKTMWRVPYHFLGWKFETKFPKLEPKCGRQCFHPQIFLQPWLCWMNLKKMHPHL